ncbi:MAG TPA: ABC transporter permease [Cyclobacteriaceae bacterium]
MNKTLLIIQREYLSRVQKKSFIIMTILTPVIFVGIYAVVILLTIKPGEEKTINVVDESGLFMEKFSNTDAITYSYNNINVEAGKELVTSGEYSGLLVIPNIDLKKPEGITLYSQQALGISVERNIERTIKNEIEDIKLKASGIDKAILDSIKTDVNLKALNIGSGGGTGEEKESNSALASGIGIFTGFIIYLFLFVYGTQVMRGVVDEKASRIVEIVISSVKPIQMMMGKIIGIAAVGLSQFLIWIILSTFLWTAATALLMGDQTINSDNTEQLAEQEVSGNANSRAEMVGQINSMIAKTNLPKILGLLIFYFVTGYLFYAALFAMIGSAIDTEADAQQFIFPIILPIIFSFMMYGAVINDPNGQIAFWLSMIPFTSPIIMMIRVPFEIPNWQIFLSMAFMIGGFIGTTWLASRIYRVGILMHGSKVNYKTLAKWFMMKN